MRTFSSFPHFKQNDSNDCGFLCLKMICKYYQTEVSLTYLKSLIDLSIDGLSISKLNLLCTNLGIQSLPVAIEVNKLYENAHLPAVVLLDDAHYCVLYKIQNGVFYVSDPAIGRIKLDEDAFLQRWLNKRIEGQQKGIVLLITPFTEADIKPAPESRGQRGVLRFFSTYFKKYTFYLTVLIVGLLIGSGIELLLPFFLKSLVDYAINPKNFELIYVIITAQLIFFLSLSCIDIFRSRILLHINTRVNLDIISDFLLKLTRLPINFYNSKTKGDLIQRIRDNDRIRVFLTETMLSSFSAVLSVLVLSIVLYLFSDLIFFLFVCFTTIELIWIFYHLRKVRPLDNQSFLWRSKDQGKIFEIIEGIFEVKLHNAERYKKEEWEDIQVELFNINFKKLNLSQLQNGGARIINYMMVSAITLIVSVDVVNGLFSFGAMIAIISIIGQLSSPITNIINFILSWENCKISIERLEEIYCRDDETQQKGDNYTGELRDINIKRLSFTYDIDIAPVLSNIDFTIPAGKTTAIVGASGSGKTTLLSLLMKSYIPTDGDILIGNKDLSNVKDTAWRNAFGAVLQDGFIFSDTVARNIAMSDHYDLVRLEQACKLSNIIDHIESLAKGFDTTIGPDGNGLSKGQKQRILLARAIYKNPNYLFLDEATNSLDSYNEEVIVNNLKRFFKDKTIVVVAHRLSTIVDADQIVLIDEGEVKEIGSHQSLLQQKGRYYELLNKQLSTGHHESTMLSTVQN